MARFAESLFFAFIALSLSKTVLFTVANAHPTTKIFVNDQQSQKAEDCLIETKLGLLQGEAEFSRNGKIYCSFKGVPYSNTPKRFEEAKIVEPWTGVKDATKFGPSCPQFAFNTKDFVGEENCLFLNIYYPIEDQCQRVLNSTESLPVLFYIHGGSFECNSGADFGPKYIMDHCAVYVSINYRLSALGFLTTNDGLIPGNLGLKDQLLALQWTQQNIDSFGGNANSVTIVGLSAGARSVTALITSAAAKGLFHRAIAQSGSAIPAMGIKKNPTRDAKELAVRLGCSEKDLSSTTSIKDCLLAAQVKDIVANQHIGKWAQDPFLSFGPVVENLNATNPILTINPLYKLLSGDFNRVPLIIGFTENEGVMQEAFSILSNPLLVNDMNTKWEEVAPINLNYDEDYIPQEDKNKFSKQLRDYYMEDRNVSLENRQDLVNLHSDRFYVQYIMDTVEIHSRYAPVYPYVFTYKDGFCFMCSQGYPDKVATHAEEIQYMFTSFIAPEYFPGTPEAEYSEKYLNLLVTFARTGIPSETWPTRNLIKPYKNDGVEPYNWYKIDKEITELSNFLKDKRQFWKKLGLRRYDNPVDY